MGRKLSIKISNKKKIEFDIICKSLVGKEILVVDSRNKNQIGIKGVLVFESANLFYLKLDGESTVKKILKSGLVIEVIIENQKYRVNAELVSNSLVNRIKKIKN